MEKVTKNLAVILIVLVICLIGIFVAKILIVDDAWLCQNGQWIKHGNPSTVTPTTTCENFATTTTNFVSTEVEDTNEVENIKKDKVVINVSFPNTLLDPNMIDCSKVFTTERSVIKTPAIGRTALEELFKGPTELEKKAGYFTVIPDGVKIQKLIIKDGIAKVDLSKELEYQVGGSCRIGLIIAEITETLKQFSTVQKVIISIDGRTEDILQP